MIREIEIEGKTYPCVFSFLTIAQFMDRTGRSAAQVAYIGNDLKLSEIPLLFWCALKRGHEKTNKEFSLTITEVENWMEDNPALAGEIMKLFNDTQPPVTEQKKSPRIIRKG